MKHVRVMFFVIFVLLIIVIAVQNHDSFSKTVTFKLDLIVTSLETGEMSFYFISMLTFLAGVVLTGFYGITERFRLKKQIRILNKNAKAMEKELNSLRNLPVITEDVSAEDSQAV